MSIHTVIFAMPAMTQGTRKNHNHNQIIDQDYLIGKLFDCDCLCKEFVFLAIFTCETLAIFTCETLANWLLQ